MKNFLLIVVAVGILAAVPKGRVIAASSRSGPMFANQVRFDGRRLLLATGRTASLWDVTTGVRIREFVGHTEAVRSVDLSPDGRRVLTGAGNTAFGRFGSDASVRLWDAASGKELQRFDGLPQQSWQTYVRAVEFSRDSGKVMSVGGGRGLAVWDVRTGKLLFERPTQGTV